MAAERKTEPIRSHAPELRFYPNTLAFVSGSPEQSQRLRKALRFSIVNPVSDVEFAEKRWSALDAIDQFVSKNESRIKLGDFDPPESTTQMVNRLRKSTFMPADAPEFDQLVKQSLTISNRNYFHKRGEPGHTLIEAFDQLAFEKIQAEYGLGSIAEAKRVFIERVEEANEVTRHLADTKISPRRLTLALRNETSLITSPGKLVYHALTSNATEKVRYEAYRTLAQAELLQISEKHADGVKQVVGEFQTAIDDEIFDHGQRIGQTSEHTIWAFFDKETGEPVWNSYSDGPLSSSQFMEFSQTANLKSIDADVRNSEAAGNVLTNPRTKGKKSIFEKMIIDAETREKLTGDSVIEPGGVTDLGGIMHVLLDEDDINGARINEFIDQHRDLAINTFGPEAQVVIRDQKTARNASSKKHNFRRLEILVPRDNGRMYKIEMLFVPLKAHLKNEYTYGKVNPDTGLREGPAHRIYESKRWVDPAIRWFPDGKQYYGKTYWNGLVFRDVERTVVDLSIENTVSAASLPLIYRQAVDK